LPVVATLVVGCEPETPPPVIAPGPVHPPDVGGAVVSARAEIGGMDELETAKAFDRVKTKFLSCYEKGLARVAYLAGDAHFMVRVTEEGKTRWAFMKESSLGNRDTELCMVDVVKTIRWPKPLGGEGLAEYTLPFDPPPDERQAVPWTADHLGRTQHVVKSALSKCKAAAGTKGLTVTLYVETDGTASSVGIASADQHGDEAADCVIAAMKAIKFPRPGSFAAKVSVESE
jgi:hypothetical protein